MGQIQLLLSASKFWTKFTEFWTKFKNEFVTNFIKEDRWKWLVDGLKNTLLITLFSLLIGILLGEGKTYEEALNILSGVTLESLVVSRRVFAAISKRAENGEVDLARYPMLCHVADVLDRGKDAQLPWESFTFDNL